MNKLTLVVLAVILFPAVARGQDTPLADVALGYSHFHIVKGFTIPTDGGYSSGAFNFNEWFGVVTDVGAYRSHGPSLPNVETYAFGPRFSYRKLDRIVPFAEALFGGTRFSTAVGGIPGTSTGNHSAFAFGGGADVLLGRSRRLAVRPEVEYFGVRVNGLTLNNVRLSLGIVFRFGKSSRP